MTNFLNYSDSGLPKCVCHQYSSRYSAITIESSFQSTSHGTEGLWTYFHHSKMTTKKRSPCDTKAASFLPSLQNCTSIASGLLDASTYTGTSNSTG